VCPGDHLSTVEVQLGAGEWIGVLIAVFVGGGGVIFAHWYGERRRCYGRRSGPEPIPC
jgi:hypothetical protein